MWLSLWLTTTSQGEIGEVEVTIHILLTSALQEVSDNFLNQPTYPGGNNAQDSPASCKAGTWFFPKVKRQGWGADYPRTSSAEVANG